jgi:hypothetical protein
MNSLVLFIYNMFIHLTNDISHLIKLSFNTPKFTRGLDALLIPHQNVATVLFLNNLLPHLQSFSMWCYIVAGSLHCAGAAKQGAFLTHCGTCAKPFWLLSFFPGCLTVHAAEPK